VDLHPEEQGPAGAPASAPCCKLCRACGGRKVGAAAHAEVRRGTQRGAEGRRGVQRDAEGRRGMPCLLLQLLLQLLDLAVHEVEVLLQLLTGGLGFPNLSSDVRGEGGCKETGSGAGGTSHFAFCIRPAIMTTSTALSCPPSTACTL
jgi:hypothetical protein